MTNHPIATFITVFFIAFSFCGCKKTSTTPQLPNAGEEFIVELPQVVYPLPVVDHITNNCDKIKKRSIKDNPVIFMLRGINDIWKGTNDSYQFASSKKGPGKNDYTKENPTIDSTIWKENIKYVIKITHNRTNNEAILAYLDEKRAKYYSVIDGFGPLTEEYVKNSGAYVDLPVITTNQVLNDTHYQSEYNDGSKYAGTESSGLGAVVKLAKDFRNTCSSTNAAKYLFSTPRPWRMNNNGEVKFSGTTYDTIKQQPTYSCINYSGAETFKIFDIYESQVKIIPGLICSRKNHKIIYDDNKPLSDNLYTNTTENRRTDNGYPSGHTNAGMLVALAYAYAFPERFPEMVLRGSQLGENRIVAGMHSPVDVIGGKTMALAIACASLNRPKVARNAEKAVSDMYRFFKPKADSANMSLFDYAHRKVKSPKGYIVGDNINVEVFNNNYYDDRAMAKKLYRKRLTYGFSQDSANIGQPPIVPKGAEAILKSRFPYLTPNQRRQVLYTTEIPSGYKIIDKTNGWGRIDLVTASDGYGSFIGDIHINMDASLGRFNELDIWGNDIDGNGYLTKDGTGKLIFTGNNSYKGGTNVAGGTLATVSKTALGSGNVSIEKQGSLEVIRPIEIKENLTLSGGTLLVHVCRKKPSHVVVNKNVELQNGTILNIIFDENILPQKGNKFEIIRGKEIQGNFIDVVAKGYNLSCKKTDNAIYVTIE